MQTPSEAVHLRIFIDEGSKSEGKPLYEAIVLKARDAGLAGAVVLRGPMGFGYSRRLHVQNILELSGNLPFIVEIVDSEDKINAFLPVLDAMMTSGTGLVTIAKVQALRYGDTAG